MFPVYTLTNNGVTISTAITAVQLKAGSNGAIEILRAWMTQANNTTSGACSGGLVRKSTAATVSTAVAGTTLVKNNPLFPTSDVVISTTGTGITGSSEGTDTEYAHIEGFNILSGFTFLATPEERIIVPQGGIIALKFIDAPASSKWYCGITFRELRAG